MEKCAVYHKAKSSYAYAYDKHTLHIKLRTKKDDVEQVTLLYADPYDFESGAISGNLSQSASDWNVHKKIMNKVGSDTHFDFWFVEIQPKWRRMKYSFLLQSNDEMIVYGEKRIVDIIDMDDEALFDQANFFAFPYLNEADIYSIPEWVKETVWYQIFPERFSNGDKSNDPKDVRPWGADIESPIDHFGGDLQGVIDQLDYLQELGINGLYLTPIFHADSNHKYDTIDYFEVDPQFGDKKVLKRLIDECHKRNIKVMFDAVLNHCGFYFDKFQDVIENGEQSKYKDWFHIKDFPVFKDEEGYNVNKNLNYHTFSFSPMMPKFNTENKEAREMLLSVGEYWAKEFNIDAWRLDVANEVDHDFWRAFRKIIKDVNKDCFILAEIWHDADAWLRSEQFDAVMNYPFNDITVDFFAKGTKTPTEFMDAINNMYFNYPANINENMYNLLDSHDTARILHMANENKDVVKLVYLFMFTVIGVPSIYYGNEVGITGGNDPDCRRCMIWDSEKQDQDMFKFMKKLIHIRKNNPVLSWEGQFEWVQVKNPSNVIIYKRFKSDTCFYIILNNSSEEIEINLPKELIDIEVLNVFLDKEFRTNKTMALKAYDYYILRKR